MNAPVVVGIGGISGGGKTSLTCKIEETLSNVTIIHMDDYYLLSTPIPEYDNFYNWDCLESVDWQQMIDDINRHLQHPLSESIIIVEGTMILNYGPLRKHFSHQFFVTLPHSEAMYRRRLKFSGKEPADYFDRYVWPAYNQCYNELLSHNDIVFLDGQEPLDKNCQRILDELSWSS